MLDRQHMWLRTRFVVGEAERAMFWQKIENQYHDLLTKKKHEMPPAAWLKLFAAALPDRSTALSLLAAHRRHRQPRPPALARLWPMAQRPVAARG